MAKKVAESYLRSKTQPEYRMKVYGCSYDIKKIPSLLRSFRDRKVVLAGVDFIPDLGVKEDFDALEVWTSDSAGLKKLASWFESRGMETTGVI